MTIAFDRNTSAADGYLPEPVSSAQVGPIINPNPLQVLALGCEIDVKSTTT